MLEPLTKATGTQLEPIKAGRTIMTLHSDKDDFIAVFDRQPLRTTISWINSAFPESKWLGAKDYLKNLHWRLGGTDFTALTLMHCWPVDQLAFGDEVAELRYKFLVRRFFSQDRRARIQAQFKVDGESPEMPPTWVDHPDLPLSKCQRAAVAFSYNQEGCALFMDRGTGKTATSINRFCNEAAIKPTMYRVLIVCPNQVRVNWQREIEKFATCNGKVTIIKGTRDERTRAFVQASLSEDDCEFSALIIGYDTLAAADEHFVRRRMWDLVVCDESHFFKSSYTKRWKTMRRLREASHQRMILTGSPIGNSPMDLWTQLEFLGHGLSGFAKFGEFRKFHGEFVPTGAEGISKLVGINHVPLLQERLTRLSFSVSKEEAGLDLPDKVYDTHEVAMTEKQAKVYKQVANDLYAELEDKLSGDVSPMTIENALTSLMRLTQITSGFFTFDAVYDAENGTELSPKRIQQISEENPKLVAVKEMLEESDPKAKTIIWCCYREDIHQLQALLEAEGIVHGAYYGDTKQDMRQFYEDEFNCNPDFKVLIANPQTAGEGLNLLGFDTNNPEESDTYCDHEIFFSQNWSAILRGQAEDRAHRRGTRMPVRITDLVVPDTIDEEIRERVKDKQAGAMTVLDIRHILEKL